ncbi:cytochrome C oxidase subunit II [Oceanobacillus longus]|uniref:Cytochrome C oxidase subunit II n=1 Tax=Oceanobacillus longus TaxID=930120 RepID=A0ABV8H0G7_9BACI
MKKNLLFSILVGFMLLLAACGGEDNSTENDATDNTDTETTEQTEASGESTEAEINNDVVMTLTNFDFDKEEYVVQSGEEVTITLVNEEGNHGISIDELDVNIQGEGEAVFVPEEPGEYVIYCNVFCGDGHEEMTATIVVL